jgi:hypothetical protein
MFSFLTKTLVIALLTGNLGGIGWCPPDGDLMRIINKPNNDPEHVCTSEYGREAFWPSYVKPVRVHGGIRP